MSDVWDEEYLVCKDCKKRQHWIQFLKVGGLDHGQTVSRCARCRSAEANRIAVRRGRPPKSTPEDILNRSAYVCSVCGARKAAEEIPRAGRLWRYCSACAEEYRRLSRGAYVPTRLSSLLTTTGFRSSTRRKHKIPIPRCES